MGKERKKLNKGLLIYYLLFFVYAVAIGGYVPYSVLYLRNIGFDSRVISIISVIIPSAAIVFQPVFGKAADKVKNADAIVSFLLILTILSICSLTVTNNIVIITIAMCAIAIANGAVYSIIVSNALKYLKRQGSVGKFSSMRLLYSVGYGAVSILMTFLLNDNLNMAFNISIASGILALILSQKIDWCKKKPERKKIAIKDVLKDRGLAVLLIFSFLAAVSTSGTYTYLPLLYSELNISDRMFALSTLIMIASEIPVFLLFPKIYKNNTFAFVFIPVISILLRTVILGFVQNNTIVILSNLINGTGFVFIQLLLTIYAKNKVDEKELSTIQSVITSVIFSGARLVSSGIVSILIGKYKIQHIQKLNAMYMLIVLTVYALYYVRIKRLRKIY